MVAAYAVISAFAGIVAVLVAGHFGWSGWVLLLVYSLAGLAAVAIGMLLALARGKRTELDAGTISLAAGPGDVSPLPYPVVPGDPPQHREIAILAVDDDPFIRELIPMIAAQAGYPSVTTAASATEALDLIGKASRPFDCLLLDINMPGMDGIALCAKLSTLAGYTHTPVIMLTALSDTAHLGRALRAGASDYITKPFDIAEFGRHLRIAETRRLARTSRTETRVPSGNDFHPVLGVPALIEPFAFDCYLSRLTGDDLASAFVVALRAEEVHDDRSPTMDRREKQLRHLAYAIDDTFGEREYLMSCLESGAFIIVSHEPRTELVRMLEVQLEARTSRALSRLSGAASAVLVGSAVRLPVRKSDRARLAVDAALSAAPDPAKRQGAGRS